MPAGVGSTLAGGKATRSAHAPSTLNPVTRCPAARPESAGAKRTTPATSVPGTKGGSSLSWYSPLISSRSGKLTRPEGPESSLATSAFTPTSADLEGRRLRGREIGDLAPLGGHVVDRRHRRERHPVVLEQRGALHLA